MSRTVLVDFLRQQAIVSQEQLNRFPYTVIGAGGTGSAVVLDLAKMGVRNLTICDPDRVERHNLPNQRFRLRDLGRPKAEALAEIVEDFTGVKPRAICQRFNDMTPAGIVISGVDSMPARREIWSLLRMKPRVAYYLDARMGGEMAHLFTLKRPWHPASVTAYEPTLADDEGALELPCTAQAIIYTLSMMSALVGRQIARLVRDEAVPAEICLDLATLTLVMPRPRSE